MAELMTQEQLLILMRQELIRIVDAIVEQREALARVGTVEPVARVSPEDLGQIVQAVSSIRPVDEAQLAALIGRVLGAPEGATPTGGLQTAIESLVAQLKRQGEIIGGMARSFGGGGGPDLRPNIDAVKDAVDAIAVNHATDSLLAYGIEPGVGNRALELTANGDVKVAAHRRFTPLGFEQITTLSAAQALTVPAGARYALIQAESQAVRFRDDGTAPTATVGTRLLADGDLFYGGDLAAIRFIEETASAKLNVAYYKEGS